MFEKWLLQNVPWCFYSFSTFWQTQTFRHLLIFCTQFLVWWWLFVFEDVTSQLMYNPTCIYKKVIAHLMKGKFSHKVIVFYDNCMWTLLFVHWDPWASVKLSTEYRLRDVDDATLDSGWDFARHLTVTKWTIQQKIARNADCIFGNILAKKSIMQQKISWWICIGDNYSRILNLILIPKQCECLRNMTQKFDAPKKLT